MMSLTTHLSRSNFMLFVADLRFGLEFEGFLGLLVDLFSLTSEKRIPPSIY